MSAKKSLGRGFDVLIPKDLDKSLLAEDKNRVQKVLISDIVPNPNQPRRDFDEHSLKELSNSIKQHGVLQPIIVVRHNKGYRIVAGERRWRAAKLAEHTDIPAIVRSLEELEQAELALIENIQRVDLSPLEQAVSIYRLQQHFNMALEQIAAKLGKAPSTLSNTTRLLQLPNAAKEALHNNHISEGHARAVLALKDETKQLELLSLIIKNKWTVRQAEQFVLATKRGSQTDRASSDTAAETPETKELSKQIKAPVRIKRTARGGQLIIGFSSDKDLKRITKLFN